MNRRLKIDPEEFRRGFPEQPFSVRHSLAGSPLFELPRLVDLAMRLPPSAVEYNAGDVPVTLDPGKTPMTGLSPEETIRRIEECRSWLVLKNVELDPEYKALLDRCLDEVAELSEAIEPGMTLRQGYVFVSSAGSVTPFHMDPEHNFLLQIRGTKTVHLFDQSDPEVLTPEQIERFRAGGHRNLVFRHEFAPKAAVFTLSPGDGLHFPIHAPHYVKNGETWSVSFSITFATPAAERAARLHHLNGSLRRWGVRPSPVGRSPFRDSLKDLAFRTARKTRRLLLA